MPGDPGGVTFAPVEAREAFDEAATRVGITGVVVTADSLAAQFVTRAAAEVVGEHDAQKFGERAKMTPALHDGIINAGVEVCRAENVNLPPHATLALLAGGWLMGVFAVVKDIKALKQNAQRGTRPAEKEKDE